jgi:hypothetical protein
VLTRTAFAAAAALMATAAFAPSAHAWTQFTFATQTGTPARVEVDAINSTRLVLVRDGATVKESTADFLEVDAFKAGDVANLYLNDTVVATATYDDLPTIDGACIGRASFAAKRAANAGVVDAGAFQMFAGGTRRLDSVWTAAETFSVSLERPLASGDVAYVATSTTIGTTDTVSFRGLPVLPCPDFGRGPGSGQPPAGPPTPTVSPAAPTAAEVLLAVRAAVSASRSSLKPFTARTLARRPAVDLPFAFPEPGTAALELLAKDKVIGTGSKAVSVNGKANVSLKLTAAGRKLLKRSKKLKVTLRGTFTPSRPGAGPQRASMSVTLRR